MKQKFGIILAPGKGTQYEIFPLQSNASRLRETNGRARC